MLKAKVELESIFFNVSFPLAISCFMLQFFFLPIEKGDKSSKAVLWSYDIYCYLVRMKRSFPNIHSMYQSRKLLWIVCNFFKSEAKIETSLATFQSMLNAKLSLHRFWPCHENGLIKTIQAIPQNLYVSFKSTSLYCGLRIILVYPNPQ